MDLKWDFCAGIFIKAGRTGVLGKEREVRHVQGAARGEARCVAPDQVKNMDEKQQMVPREHEPFSHRMNE